MEIKELKSKSVNELQHDLQELRSKLDELSFKARQSQIKNVRELRVVKKNIAKILTVLREKK